MLKWIRIYLNLKSILIEKLIKIVGDNKSKGVINIFKEEIVKKGVKFTEKTLKANRLLTSQS